MVYGYRASTVPRALSTTGRPTLAWFDHQEQARHLSLLSGGHGFNLCNLCGYGGADGEARGAA